MGGVEPSIRAGHSMDSAALTTSAVPLPGTFRGVVVLVAGGGDAQKRDSSAQNAGLRMTTRAGGASGVTPLRTGVYFLAIGGGDETRIFRLVLFAGGRDG